MTTAGGSSSRAASGSRCPTCRSADTIGAGEGKLNIVNWAGYAENGSTDKNRLGDAVREGPGCQVELKIASTSDEMVTLMRTGRYDGVSASGNASVRLIAGGDVRPDRHEDPHRLGRTSIRIVKNQPYNSVDGQMYGAPHGYGANLLIGDTENISPAPTAGRRVRRQPVQGQGHRLRRPDLHRRRGAVPVEDADRSEDHQPVRARPEAVRRSRRSDEEAAAARRAVLVGLHQEQQAASRRATRRGHDLAGTSPTCWKPTSSPSRRCSRRRAQPAGRTHGCCRRRRKHPNCMLKWMNWIQTPDVQAQVAEWFGEAPANLKACDLTRRSGVLQHVSHQRRRATSRRSSSGRRRLATAAMTAATTCVDYSSGSKPGPR